MKNKLNINDIVCCNLEYLSRSCNLNNLINQGFLTIHKYYVVNEVKIDLYKFGKTNFIHEYILIKDDKGDIDWYAKEFFVDLKELRKNKLNEIAYNQEII